MIDFDKEEFLARLDLRINTMANMLAYHETYLTKLVVRKEQHTTYTKTIYKSVEYFENCLKEYDKKIQDYFDKLRESYKNEE